MAISGRLLATDEANQYELITSESKHLVTLGNRNATWIGFSILDLKPFRTDVFISGQREGDIYFADRIEFAPVGDPLQREQAGLPRCLFIGDTISFNYQRTLREALAGKVNLHHPPTNCAGSKNWRHVSRWMGAIDEPGRDWDVIVFNFGLWDSTTSKEEYQANLKNAIKYLRRSHAKLIWVTTTPIDYGFNTDINKGEVVPDAQRAAVSHEAEQLVGQVPGRMRLQNEWAAEVLKDFPDIEVCDLFQVVVNGRESVYKNWWYNKSINFSYRESVPLGRILAGHILTALGQNPEDINPPTVHSVKMANLKDLSK